MGQSFASGFPELAPYIGPVFDEGIRSGVAQDVVESPMMVHRNGYREETFFTGNFTPVRGVDGEIEGFYNALFEVTSQMISDRRKRMLNMLTTPSVVSTDAVFEHIIASLATDPLDVPMALLFEADVQAEPGKTILRLRGHLGIQEGHKLLLDGQDLADVTDVAGVASLCRQANDGKVLTTRDERFDSVDWLGFKTAPETIVTMPLRTSRRQFGFLVMGTNPYRPFDDACEQFTTDLMGTASNLLAAALDADNLRREQQQLQNELEFSDLKVRHLVEHASIGMAHAKPDGTLLWANDKFLSLAGLPIEKSEGIESMFEVLVEDDQDQAHEVWTRIFNGDDHVSAEFRLKQSFQPPIGGQESAQIQLLAFPFKEHGVTVSGMACITDISHLKWAEAWQARAAQEARDAKRQQEAFIDVVSHEMRNPLSAIVHCADSISMALIDTKAKGERRTDPDSILETLEANASAASIILDCCKHQKRIM
jgi:PAS domain-containing protein